MELLCFIKMIIKKTCSFWLPYKIKSVFPHTKNFIDHRLHFQILLHIFSSQSIFSTFYLCLMGVPIFDKASFHSWHKLQPNCHSLKCCELSLSFIHMMKFSLGNIKPETHCMWVINPCWHLLLNPVDFKGSNPKALTNFTGFFWLVWLTDILIYRKA